MVVTLIRRDKTDYQRKLIYNFKHRPQQFCGYINKMRTVKNKISHIIRKDGIQTADDQEAASVDQSYAAACFSRLHTSL